MRTAHLFPIAFLSIACQGADGGAEPEIELPVESVEPQAGVWAVDTRSVLRDECGGILGEDQAGLEEADKDLFDLLVREDDTFTIVITFDDGESYELDCLRDGADFTCDGTMDVYTVADTTLTVTWSGGGEFFGDSELSALLDATGSCEGSLCGVAESYLGAPLPCDGTMSMDASYRSP